MPTVWKLPAPGVVRRYQYCAEISIQPNLTPATCTFLVFQSPSTLTLFEQYLYSDFGVHQPSMRGGYMNGKYPSGGRGGSSFRGGRHGPPRHSSGGNYYDPYYNSSPPARGGRGSYRGGSGWPSRGGRGGYYSSPGSSYHSLPIGTSTTGVVASAPSPGEDSRHNSSTPVGDDFATSINSEMRTPGRESHLPNEQGNDGGNDGYWNNGYYSGIGRGGSSSSRFSGRGGRGGRAHDSRYTGGNGEYAEQNYYNNEDHKYGKPFYGGRYEEDNGRPGSRPASAGYPNLSLNNKLGSESRGGPSAVPHRTLSFEEKSRLEAVEKKKNEEQNIKRELEKLKEAEFRQKHWISRIHAKDPVKASLVKLFDELDQFNSNLLEIGARRAALEIDVARHARILRAEEDRVRLADERLEAMNLSLSL